MFNDEDSQQFVAAACADVQAEVKQLFAVQQAVGFVCGRLEKGRIRQIYDASMAKFPDQSQEMTSAGACAQWAQEKRLIEEFGVRLQRSRDRALSEINSEQARKRAEAYRRNLAAERGA